MPTPPELPTDLLLVTEQDDVIGRAEKLRAHQNGGLLHRAFSVLIFNAHGDWLLQQRAPGKYHSGGLWTNACCGHPTRPTHTGQQAEQRLEEEMGFTVPLTPFFAFTYHAHLPNGLTEHEFDHVFTGQYNGPIPFNPAEVMGVRWISPADLRQEMTNVPESFTVWFKLLMEEMKRRGPALGLGGRLVRP